MAAVEQTSMHWLQPGFCERLCAQIDALYAKYFGFSNSPVSAAISVTALRLRDRDRRRARGSPAAAGACARCGVALQVEDEVEALAARVVAAASKSIAAVAPQAATHLRCALQRSRSIW